MSLKDIVKHALAAGAERIKKIEGDHYRMEWLEEDPDRLHKIHFKVVTDKIAVRDAIDEARKQTTDERFDATDTGDMA